MSKSDTRHLTALIEPHLDVLFRAAFRFVRNRPDAEDLVQETCVRACRRISTLDSSRNVKAWLLRVMHNVFVDGVRRTQRSPITSLADRADCEASIADTNPGPGEATYESQREEQLLRAWARLPRGQRSLLALRAEGYGLSEIADITNLEVDALNARLYRARRSFAKFLKQEELNEPKERVEVVR